MTIESSHELSLKPTSSLRRPIIIFPRRLISGRSFRANRRERIDRSLPRREFSLRSRARVRIHPYDIPRRCIWKIRSDGRKREKRVATVGTSRRAKCILARENSRSASNCTHGRARSCIMRLCRTCGCMCIEKLARRSAATPNIDIRSTQLHAACPFIKMRTCGSISLRSQ